MSNDLSGYRPVSRLAVAAAVAGAVSALAIASPFFGIVPLVGITLACLALADVRRAGAEKAGRAVALVGLALSIGFGAQAMSAAAASRWIAASRAGEAARFWLDVVREGRQGDAMSMCLPEAMEAAAKVAALMPSEDTACDLVVRADGASEHAPDGIVVRATIQCRDAGRPRTIAVHVVPEPTSRSGRAGERWMIARCDTD